MNLIAMNQNFKSLLMKKIKKKLDNKMKNGKKKTYLDYYLFLGC